MEIAGKEYVIGQDRNEDNAVAHLYAGTFADPGNPMCARGWNRAGGHGYSIFRNVYNTSICLTCMRRAAAHLPPVEPRDRKTKWI